MSMPTMLSGEPVQDRLSTRQTGRLRTACCLTVVEAPISAPAKDSEPQEIMTCSRTGPTCGHCLQPERAGGCVYAEGAL